MPKTMDHPGKTGPASATRFFPRFESSTKCRAFSHATQLLLMVVTVTKNLLSIQLLLSCPLFLKCCNKCITDIKTYLIISSSPWRLLCAPRRGGISLSLKLGPRVSI